MQRRKSTTGGQHSFAQIPRADIQRSVFDRSCGLKTTFDSGFLVPIFVDEALPGDTMSLQLTNFARMATPLHPVMDNMFMDVHFFSVPMRLVWENWQRFNGEQASPADTTDFLIPTMNSGTSGGYLEGSIHDYLGIPPGIEDLEHSCLWHRACNLIFNEWFRDENLQNAQTINIDDGPDDPADYALLRRGKRHDYFSSCLPFPQKGPSVNLGLGASAPLVFDNAQANVNALAAAEIDRRPLMAAHDISATYLATNQSSGTTQAFESASTLNANTGVKYYSWATGDGDPALQVATADLSGVADLTNSTAATINQIREAFQIQRLYERDARGGSRYTEILRSHFGVTSPDQRLQRPEFLGGGSQNINMSSVPQTSSTDGTSPQGHLTAYATFTGQTGFNKSFVEHCLVLGFVSVRADLNYQQGLPRMFSRSTRWDFYWPALAHLGEQSVKNVEIFAQGDGVLNGDSPPTPIDDDVFGYQERFAEYRYKPSMVTAAMRSSAATSLDTWHLAQDFATLPVLDSTFIQETPPISRVVAVPSEPEFIFDSFFKFRHARPMPTYSVPGLVDHF